MGLADEGEGKAKDNSFMIYVTTLMVNPFFGNWQRAEMMDGVVRSEEYKFNIRHIHVKACKYSGCNLYSSSPEKQNICIYRLL